MTVQSQSVVVHVKLLGFLKRWSGPAQLDLEIRAGSTMRDLIYLLTERLGDEFRQAILDWHGNLHGGVELILNGQEIPSRRISEIVVWDESDLVIVPIIAGG